MATCRSAFYEAGRNPNSDQSLSGFAEIAFFPSNPSNFPTFSMNHQEIQAFQKVRIPKQWLEMVGNGWKSDPSNHFQPSWTLNAASTLQSWTVGKVGRLFW